MKQHSKQKGFTIIEVVLVLAIAALIFLVVFLAVPALQRSQRDTQRRSDMGRLQTAITNYAGNHQGTLPTVDAAFATKYLNASGDKWEDPKVGAYVLTNVAAPGIPLATLWSDTASNVNYRAGVKCNTNGSTAPGGARQFAIQIVLESNDLYCVSN